MKALNYLVAIEDQIYAKREFGKDRLTSIGDTAQFMIKSQEDLQVLLERRTYLREIMGQYEQQLAEIDKKAKFRSNIVGLGISSILFAELAIIAQGTFVTLSWDIMEPISYLMALGNFTAGFGWYYLFITNPECQTPPEWLRYRVRKKLMRKRGVDQEVLDQINKELDLIDRKIEESNI